MFSVIQLDKRIETVVFCNLCNTHYSYTYFVILFRVNTPTNLMLSSFQQQTLMKKETELFSLAYEDLIINKSFELK